MQDFLVQVNSITIQCKSYPYLERNNKLKEKIMKEKALIEQKVKKTKFTFIELLNKRNNYTINIDHILNINHSFRTHSPIKNKESVKILPQCNFVQIYSVKNQKNLKLHYFFIIVEVINNKDFIHNCVILYSLEQVFIKNTDNSQSINMSGQLKHFNVQSILDYFSMFQSACNNILDTYFTLLIEKQFLSLQTQQEIQNKIYFLNKTIYKSILTTIQQLLKLYSSKPLPITSQSINLPQNNEHSSLFQKSDLSSNQILKKSRKTKIKKTTKKGKNQKIPYQLTLPLQRWLLNNFNHPYPSLQEKRKISKQTGLQTCQVNNWFINARQRVIKKFLLNSSTVQENKNKSRTVEENKTKVQKYKKRDKRIMKDKQEN